MRRPSIRTAGRTFLGHVLVAPVVDGRPEPATWHPVLRLLGGISCVAFLAALAHIIAAEQMRAVGPLVPAGPELHLPAAAVPMVAVGVFLAMTLLQTAALHLAWPLRILALVAGAATVGGSVINASQTPVLLWAAVGSWVVLVVFHLARIGRRFSGLEVVVVAGCVFVGTQLPMLGSGAALALGYEMRGLVLTSQMQFLLPLAVPALITAGTALAQVAVTSGEAVGAVAVRKLGLRSLQIALAALLLWRTWVLWRDLSGSIPSLLVPDLVASLLALLVATGVAVPFVVRARRHGSTEVAGPGSLADVFGGVSYLLAAAATLWMIVPNAVMALPTFLLGAGLQTPDWVWQSTAIVNHSWTPTLSRVVAAVLCLGVAWRWARRGKWLGGVLVAAFLGPQLVSFVGVLLPDASLRFSTTGLGFWLHAALLAATVVVAVRRDDDQRRVAALLGAAAILTLHDFRDVLENPVAAALGFSALGALLFGTVWRVLTDGEFTRGDSRGFPQPTRVLLYLANAMFVTTVLAYSALTRDATGFLDIAIWEDIGDSIFAVGLWFAAVLVALWLAVSTPRSQPDTTPQSVLTNSYVNSSREPSTRV